MINNTLTIRNWESEAKELWQAGEKSIVIGIRFGVTANTIIGLAWRRKWGAHPNAVFHKPKFKTTEVRINLLHTKFDEIVKYL